MKSEERRSTNVVESAGLRKLLLLAVVIVLVWTVQAMLIYYFLNDWQQRGTFGDMFGAINSLFTGLAFGGLIYTVLLQREDLALQREELRLTRDELRGQKQALRRQSDILHQQTFENTFFRLVALHHEIVNSLRLEKSLFVKECPKKVELLGRECFTACYEEFRSLYLQCYVPDSFREEKERIGKAYGMLMRHRQADIVLVQRELDRRLFFLDSLGL